MIWPAYILLGVGLLVAGRRLFWLFVAAAGFVLGAQLILRGTHGPEWIAVAAGVLVGVLFAGMAVFLKSIAVVLAGFLAGGSIALGMAGILGYDPGGMTWLVYIVGGIIGSILMSLIFDWALVLLSSLAGAALLVQGLGSQGWLWVVPQGVAFVLLVILGLFLQSMGAQSAKKDD